jgi:hypothetical protein
MWMPRPCTWNDLNAASTPYDPVLARQAGRMPVSAALRARRGQAQVGRDRHRLSGMALGSHGRGRHAAWCL